MILTWSLWPAIKVLLQRVLICHHSSGPSVCVIFLCRQEIQYAKTKSFAIAKLDGTYKVPPLKKLGAGSQNQTTSTIAVKREREADTDSDSDSAMSE